MQLAGLEGCTRLRTVVSTNPRMSRSPVTPTSSLSGLIATAFRFHVRTWTLPDGALSSTSPWGSRLAVSVHDSGLLHPSGDDEACTDKENACDAKNGIHVFSEIIMGYSASLRIKGNARVGEHRVLYLLIPLQRPIAQVNNAPGVLRNILFVRHQQNGVAPTM